MSGIIIIFHTQANTGYAMAPLEKTFFDMALQLVPSIDQIHFGFKNYEAGSPQSLPANFTNLVEIDPERTSTLDAARHYIERHKITYAFCFDLQVKSKIGSMLRAGGVKKIISYWGATISSENRGLKLITKRIEVALDRNKPEHFIFESEAMRHFAVSGRGIVAANTSVIPTGIDTQKYHPQHKSPTRLKEIFNIPPNAFVVFYSGHMERRKGVHVIIESAKFLGEALTQENIYFLIAGNKPGEEAVFIDQLEGHSASQHVIFAGYRRDLNQLIPCCTLGVIASTGWDSFPMSSLEMAASGLPLLVSDLQGLKETVEEGVTGLKFPPGDHIALANQILNFAHAPEKIITMGLAARRRIENGYSTDHQLAKLVATTKRIYQI